MPSLPEVSAQAGGLLPRRPDWSAGKARAGRGNSMIMRGVSAPLFAVETLDPLAARHSRQVQRELAAAAFRRIEAVAGRAPALRSHSHSRGLAASAQLAKFQGAALGIDVEYQDAARNWQGILQLLVGTMACGLPDRRLCTLWTFVEAYFKAFGTRPDAARLERMRGAVDLAEKPVEIGPGTFWMHRELEGRFALSLVWKGEGLLPVDVTAVRDGPPASDGNPAMEA